MILSFATSEPSGTALGVCSWAAVLAYVAAAHSAYSASTGSESRASSLRFALLVAWCFHALALVIDIAGIGQELPGARFGFAPALSMTVWMVLAVYLVESSFVPLPGARRVLAALACVFVLLAWRFPGELRPLAGSPWAPLHWVLGLASYGLFGAAVLHAAMLTRAEREMRRLREASAALRPAGMPLLRLERLTFQFVGAGVLVLSLALLLGWWFTPHWRWDHKNLFSVMGWVVLTSLLTGRRLFGWRGRRATRWLYFGAALLLLSYVGSRFVLEVVLQRAPA
jgi:ABC-type uncharacterized transport system permease subunit